MLTIRKPLNKPNEISYLLYFSVSGKGRFLTGNGSMKYIQRMSDGAQVQAFCKHTDNCSYEV